ncbi:MAG: alpha/beta hydrolase [Muribaculum sp.]|nr:alpha/beta hydrolase [Muribaculaceae bacterium]MCM1081090.1 alpha/beta hydrolase [Muribaculum sp.]
MTLKHIILTALITVTWGCSPRVTFDNGDLSTGWRTDTLGPGFESRYVDQGHDYSGQVRSTIIRHTSPCGDSLKRGVLYIHGYNDYFFQKEMAERFADSCYSFYAVDLRKYGRSIMPGQRIFDVRNISEYYPDIDSALAVMKNNGIDSVVMIGHSTGGLTASSYINDRKPQQVKRLILNSPFLDWNMSEFMEEIAIPAAAWIGRFVPGVSINQPQGTSYAESLLKSGYGQWDFNTNWKVTKARPVTTGWLHAINSAQKKLQKSSNIQIPVLLMHSDKSYSGQDTAMIKRSDVVLDVNDIQRYGSKLGRDVTSVTVNNGIHDLILSQPCPREQAYKLMFQWLDR